MAKIRITSGVFGWNHGTYDLVRAGDPPIEVEEALARRLVEEKGVAEYVAPASEVIPSVSTEMSLEGMTVKELRNLAEEYGITIEKDAKKADMIAALEAAWPEDNEDAPTFDAAEAVQ